MRFRQSIALVVALAALEGCLAVAANARRADPHAADWRATLSHDASRFPAIARSAEARVSGRPLYFQVAFVAGAIGGKHDPLVCPVARRDPHDFVRAARRQIFRHRADYAYVRSRGWTVGSVLTTYRQGILFGCSSSG